MIEWLDSVGLEGSFQVHVAQQLLVVDRRAHQVFVGFSGLEEQVRRHLGSAYSDAECVMTDGGRLPLSVASFAERVVVPRIEAENPGGVASVVWLVDRLLGPGGCPWDQAQTHQSLKKYLIEEAYELVEAIDRGGLDDLKEELGDVLLQPVMHAQMQARDGSWNSNDVADNLVAKLIRRHPHVFGEAVATNSDEVLSNWDAIKKKEKATPTSILAGVPSSMPALLRALEISKRAARSGFEWESMDGVWDKVSEEMNEVKEAIETGNAESVSGEIGDLLFTIVNIARWQKIDPEESLRRMLDRFVARFTHMENASDKPLADLSPVEWDDLWNQAKRATT